MTELEALQAEADRRALQAELSRRQTAAPGFQGGAAGAAALGAADTASFGFGDELGAGLGAASEYLASKITGQPARSYEELLGAMRQQDTDAQESNPYAYMGGQLAGGVATGLAAAPATFSARAGSTLVPRVAAGIGDGLVLGGLYGAGSGEGLEGRGWEAAKNAAIGGAAGAAFPLVSAGASRAYEAGRNALNAGPIAQRAGSSPQALRLLGDVMEADGSLGPRGTANMARAGNEAMLADAGPNARMVLDAAIQRGGPGAVLARDAIDARVARGTEDVAAALNASLGDPQGVTAARTAIREGSAGARQGAYDAAYGMPIDYASDVGQRLESMIRNRVPGNVVSGANNLMRIKDEQSRQILARIADDGSVTYESLPDVRQIDYITRALNQAAESGDGAGALGGQTTLGRAYQELSRDLRGALREAVPEYGQALETAADPIRRSQAVEFGSRLLSTGTTRDQVAEFTQGITGPERDAIAQGVRSRIDDAMANVTRTIQDGNTDAREAVKAIKEMSSRANRSKLTEAIGEERAAPLFDELDRVATSFDLRSSVAENTKTYARQATDRRISQIAGPNAAERALAGEPIKASQRVAQLLTGQTPERIRGREDQVYSEIARLLTMQGGAGQGVYDAVSRIGVTDAATRQVRDRIASALLGPQYAYPAGALAGGNQR